MIAPSKQPWHSAGAEQALAPSWTERMVCCRSEVPAVIGEVLARMSQHAFSISDGLAIQYVLTELLTAAFESPGSEAGPDSITIRFRVDRRELLIALPDGEESSRSTSAELTKRASWRVTALSLYREHLTSVTTSRDQAGLLLLRRSRGHNSSSSLPPEGYDFQI